MTAAHTPGPWEVEPAGADGNSDYGMRQMDGTRALLYLHINAPGAGGGRIGRCFSNCLVTTDEQLHANANLFAAAPGLLAACEAVIAFVEGKPDAVEPFGLVRAAIAAATGGAADVPVMRECCNAECGWMGETDRMLGSIGPLCPDCGEVTEPVVADATPGSTS